MKVLLRGLLLTMLMVACARETEPAVVSLDPLMLDDAEAEDVLESPPPTEAERSASGEGKAKRALDVPRDLTRVAVLGYHNFSETEPVSQMLLRTSEFRAQMEYIRQAGLTVISMQEFLEWRLGTRTLPARCVLITMDDGWRSVYTDAYPILKEYGYPFTLFLYTNFLHGRGESLTPAQVREMQANGATVGSHSVNHLYPSDWAEAESEGSAVVEKMLAEELGESQRKLSKLFGRVNTYCYPGGYSTPAMVENMPRYGYVAAFTVVPGKVTVTEVPLAIPRYMIFGDDGSVFRSAVDFRVAQLGTVVSTGSSPGTLPAKTPPPPFAVSPQPHETVAPDFPSITAYMSGVAGVNFSTVQMKVSGFGQVPAKVDKATRAVQWVLPCRIYMPNLSVHVTWKSTDGTSHKAEWSFSIDPNAPIKTVNSIP